MNEREEREGGRRRREERNRGVCLGVRKVGELYWGRRKKKQNFSEVPLMAERQMSCKMLLFVRGFGI